MAAATEGGNELRRNELGEKLADLGDTSGHIYAWNVMHSVSIIVFQIQVIIVGLMTSYLFRY